MSEERVADILIVEDDPGFQKQLQEYTAIHKCSAFCVGNLADARSVLGEWSYDLVLLDVQLPDGLSTELTGLIPETPVLYISEIADSALIRSLITKSPNVIGYLAKPIALDRFSLTLTAALNAARQFRANVQAQQALATEVDGLRDRIHADLHDGLSQHLVGMDLLAGTLARGLDDAEPDLQALRKTVDLLRISIGGAKQTVRDVARPLDGQDEGSGSLDDWVDTLVQSWSVIQDRVAIYTDIDARCAKVLGRDRSRLVFKIVREAVTNAIRHANASVVTIGLRVNDIPPVLHGSVTDDGEGMAAQALPGREDQGSGLAWMRTRVRMLNGSFDMKTVAGGGTSIEFRVPLGESTGYSNRSATDVQGMKHYRALFFEQVERLLSEIGEVEDVEARRRLLGSLAGLSRLAGFEAVASVADQLDKALDSSAHAEVFQSLQSAVASCIKMAGESGPH